MLKIKKDVDLKELEKFGFKPKYSEETGELIQMYRMVKIKNYERMGATIIKQPRNFWQIFKWNRRITPYFGHINLEIIDYEILYDLIQAGLVEKIEE